LLVEWVSAEQHWEQTFAGDLAASNTSTFLHPRLEWEEIEEDMKREQQEMDAMVGAKQWIARRQAKVRRGFWR